MKQAKVDINYPIAAAKLAVENTLNFENSAFFTKYEKPDKEDMKSVLNLYWQDNFILDTVIPYLKENSSVIPFGEEREDTYYGKPLKLSYDQYGVIDYWWIILAVNGYANAQEFTGWENLLIPSRNAIAQIIDKMEYSDGTIGVINKDEDDNK